jgi:hypothetical protein
VGGSIDTADLQTSSLRRGRLTPVTAPRVWDVAAVN